MTIIQPSTTLVLPNIVTKYALMSQSVETLSDGTNKFEFKGFVSHHDAHMFYLTMETFNDNGSEQQFKEHVIFKGSGTNYDWSVKQNFVPKGGKFYITFTLNDRSNTTVKKDMDVKLLMDCYKSESEWLEFCLHEQLRLKVLRPHLIQNCVDNLRSIAKEIANATK